MGYPIELPLADLPEKCPNCWETPESWPLGVHGGRLNVTCGLCHTIVAEIVAIKPADN
jgi:hypothetical protein